MESFLVWRLHAFPPPPSSKIFNQWKSINKNLRYLIGCCKISTFAFGVLASCAWALTAASWRLGLLFWMCWWCFVVIFLLCLFFLLLLRCTCLFATIVYAFLLALCGFYVFVISLLFCALLFTVLFLLLGSFLAAQLPFVFCCVVLLKLYGCYLLVLCSSCVVFVAFCFCFCKIDVVFCCVCFLLCFPLCYFCGFGALFATLCFFFCLCGLGMIAWCYDFCCDIVGGFYVFFWVCLLFLSLTVFATFLLRAFWSGLVHVSSSLVRISPYPRVHFRATLMCPYGLS